MTLPPVDGGRVPVRRGTPGPRGGGLYLSRVQLTRMLDAAVGVVAEEGVKRLSATRVSARAGMSSKTFYDLFAGGEDCFLAVFDRAVGEWAAELAPAWAGEVEWVERVRAALVVLLASLERDPVLARVVFVHGLGAGPRVLARRAEVLDRVAGFIDEGREDAGDVAGELPPMTAAGVLGGAFSMIHARLVEQDAKPLTGLLNDLMATIVLPYRGREAAARELSRPAPELPASAAEPEVESEAPAGVALPDVLPEDFRLTVRRQAVLCAVAELCGEGLEPCNREVCERVGIAGDPQVSRFMVDLETQGLVENTRIGLVGTRKAWRVTPKGRAVLGIDSLPAVGIDSGGRALIKKERPEERPASKGARVNGRSTVRSDTSAAAVPVPGSSEAESSVAERQRGRRDAPTIAPLDFRLTVRTQMALVVVAKANARGANPSNLQVAQRIGISAKAAVSRMMSRLQDQGLIENTRGRDTKGVEKAWRLTAHGQAVLDAHRPGPSRRGDPAGVRGGKLVPKRGQVRPAPVKPASGGLPRLTVRTHFVLTALAELGGRGSYPSNREIAAAAGVRDEGQISKLLARLQDHGLLHNTTRGGHGNPKSWRLTPQGEALLHDTNPEHQKQEAA